MAGEIQIPFACGRDWLVACRHGLSVGIASAGRTADAPNEANPGGRGGRDCRFGIADRGFDVGACGLAQCKNGKRSQSGGKEGPPRRRREHRDERKCNFKKGLGLFLRVLCGSVVIPRPHASAEAPGEVTAPNEANVRGRGAHHCRLGIVIGDSKRRGTGESSRWCAERSQCGYG